MTGAVTDDGCPVEVYRLFPEQGEAELIHAAVPAGASVLDLGCGTGRIADPLAGLGHEVVAVDQSAEMLSTVRRASPMHAPIAGLDLGRTFGAVVLASHLLNTVDDVVRADFLSAAAHHLTRGGRLVAEVYPVAWFDTVRSAEGGHIGTVGADLTDVQRDGPVVAATIVYRLGERSWSQPFTALRRDEAELAGDLAVAGLEFAGWIDAERSWFAGVRT